MPDNNWIHKVDRVNRDLYEALQAVSRLKASSHDPIFEDNHFSNSKKFVTRINIFMSRNNARKITGSKKWIV